MNSHGLWRIEKGKIWTETNAMSLDQLMQLKKDIERAINSFVTRRLAESRKALEAKAAEFGVSLAEVMGGKPARGVKAAAAAKYALPENAATTWSGRGASRNGLRRH